MKTEIDISSSVLIWVMSQIVNSQQISEQVADNLQKWLTGEKKPTFNQVEQASKATGIPLGYFFLDNPPQLDLSLLEYRTIKSAETDNPSPNLVKTIYDMERIQDWLREDIIMHNEDELEFVGSKTLNENADNFANDIRKRLNIPINWQETCPKSTKAYVYLREVISCIGITVMFNGVVGVNTHRPLNVNEFRAFALCDKYAPLIFINNNDSDNGKLFSLIHELAHIWLGENNVLNESNIRMTSKKDIEVLCNAVASEIIVPQVTFTSKWELTSAQSNKEMAINSLSAYFKCSRLVIARKALDNNYISQRLYDKIAKETENNAKKHSSGGNFYNTLKSRNDKRFLNRLVASVNEGRTTYSEALRLTNTKRGTFTKLVEGEDKI